MGDRLVQSSILQQGAAEVVVGFRAVRIDLQGLLVMGDRLVQFSLLQQDAAEVVVGFRVVRLDGRAFWKWTIASSTLPFCTRALPRLLWAGA